MVFYSAYEINLYIANACRDLYYGVKKNIMKKEYMKKRLEKWCVSHNCFLEIFPSGVVSISYYDGLIDSELYTSFTACYNSVFNVTDSEE